MSAFTEDMLKSMAKVEATRAQRLHASIERFTAEEKDELLKEFHPDYSSKGFKVLEVGPNKGQKVPVELAQLLEGKSRLQDVERCKRPRSYQAAYGRCQHDDGRGRYSGCG